MGLRGPRPQPTHLKLLRGNPGRRPLNDREPQPRPGKATAPSWLHGKARRAWRRLAPMLARLGVLTEADEDALALLCSALGEYTECRQAIRETGSVYLTTTATGDTMVRPRPEVAIASDAWRRVHRMMAEFGMTPSSRSRLQTGGNDDEDPFSEFLRGGKHD